MKRTQQVAAIVIVLLAGFTIYGFWETRQPLPSMTTASKKQSGPAEKPLIDQSSLTTAQHLAQLATTHDERPLAQEALRLADYDVDIAFQNAIRQARLHPPPLSAEAKECKERQHKAEQVLQSEQERAKALSEQLAKAPPSRQDTLQADLIQAEADIELAQDEVDDAKHDLLRAGGDPVGRIQALKQEHEQAAHGSSSVPTGPETPDQVGLVHRAMQWRTLHEKQLQLWQAKADTEASLAQLVGKHDALDAQIDSEKSAVPQLAHHSKKNKTGAANPSVPSANANMDQVDSVNLLKKTQDIAENQKVLSAYDERIDTEKELAGVYGQWIDLVRVRQRAVINRAFVDVGIVLLIALVAVFFSSWMDSLVKRLKMDRRQIESLRTVTSVSLQVLALFLILLVFLGPPGQLGTFLGLAGAGLTVALKDFIVGFIGWFVLMGKNGMRLGDWVEINGVTGEVMEIGPFHTVLLETGNWTDSGHPTGRRVTFTNSFAIEGHYFNFSTTGQWLWDELTVVLPFGKDPYPLLDAIHKKVIEATRESVQQAEDEWKTAITSRELGSLSAAPAISVKPVVGGIEIAVRYVTRASDRYALRAKLNQAAVELLGAKSEPVAT